MNDLKTNEDYALAFEAISGLIKKWDPYELISGGAPSNEFDNEVFSIISRVKEIKNEQDAAKVISSVFSNAFDEESFTPGACIQQGNELFLELKKHGMI